MGCCQSTTATHVSVGSRSGPGASGEATETNPVLLEVTAKERAMAELKRIFEGVDTLNGHASKAELQSSLKSEEADLASLLKEAGLAALLDMLNKLLGHEGEFVSWEEFEKYAEQVVAEKIQEEVKVAEKVIEQEVAKGLDAGDKALQCLKDVFDKMVADAEGAVSKEDLIARLQKDVEEAGENLEKILKDAGFNIDWSCLEQLDTNKDGRVTWEELEAHVRSAAHVLEEEIEYVTTKRCGFCC